MLKILFYAVYEELPSKREIERAFKDQRLCKEVGIDSVCDSSLSGRTAEINQEVLMELFTNLVQKLAACK